MTESWRLPGTLAWELLVAALFIGTQVVTAVAVGDRPGADGYLLSLGTLLSALVCVPILFGIAGLKRGANLRDYFALRGVSARTLLAWMGITLVLLALSDGLTWLLGKPIVPEFMRLMYQTGEPLWLLWLALVVGAPVFEETFFRGFLFTGFSASAGPAGAILVTAALWAAIHQQYDLYGIATLFVLGVVFGLARLRTGSLYVPLALHAMTNLVAAAEAAWLG